MFEPQQNNLKAITAEWRAEASGEGLGAKMWRRKISLVIVEISQQAIIVWDLRFKELKLIFEPEASLQQRYSGEKVRIVVRKNS